LPQTQRKPRFIERSAPPGAWPVTTRNHSSPLSRAAGSLAALTLLITCGQSAAAEPRLELAQAATGAATSQPRLTPQQREADYVAQLDKMVAPLLDYQLSDEDNTKINAAFKALSGSDLAKAKDLQAGLSDPLARKLVEWERLRGGEGQAAEYLKFLSENPDWPSREQLQRRMEETLFEEGGDTDVIATYFKGREARSPAGMAVLASAVPLINAGSIRPLALAAPSETPLVAKVPLLEQGGIKGPAMPS